MFQMSLYFNLENWDNWIFISFLYLVILIQIYAIINMIYLTYKNLYYSKKIKKLWINRILNKRKTNGYQEILKIRIEKIKNILFNTFMIFIWFIAFFVPNQFNVNIIFFLWKTNFWLYLSYILLFVWLIIWIYSIANLVLIKVDIWTENDILKSYIKNDKKELKEIKEKLIASIKKVNETAEFDVIPDYLLDEKSKEKNKEFKEKMKKITNYMNIYLKLFLKDIK